VSDFPALKASLILRALYFMSISFAFVRARKIKKATAKLRWSLGFWSGIPLHLFFAVASDFSPLTYGYI
jgi:hypothetical protein